jgi:predicted nucleic acid-binding protein
MGVKYLWDTNIVIYYLQQQFPSQAEKFIDNILIDHPPCISAITEIELLCWKTEIQKDIEILQDFIKNAIVIELEQPIKLNTALIRKQYNIKLPDAIIAATAKVHDLTLISRNTQDFKDIKEIQNINPWQLEDN